MYFMMYTQIFQKSQGYPISGAGRSGCMLQRTGGARRFSGWEARGPEGIRGDGPRVGGIASCMPADCTMHQTACASVCHSLIPVPAGLCICVSFPTSCPSWQKATMRMRLFQYQNLVLKTQRCCKGPQEGWFLSGKNLVQLRGGFYASAAASASRPPQPANKLGRVLLI